MKKLDKLFNTEIQKAEFKDEYNFTQMLYITR